jgi:hypothetical protein
MNMSDTKRATRPSAKRVARDEANAMARIPAPYVPCFLREDWDGVSGIMPAEEPLRPEDYSSSGFVDPWERKAIEGCYDSIGTELIGDDEHGMWWGTERAVWPLSFGAVIHVRGYVGAVEYDGYFLGTEDEAESYAVCHGVTEVSTEVITLDDLLCYADS